MLTEVWKASAGLMGEESTWEACTQLREALWRERGGGDEGGAGSRAALVRCPFPAVGDLCSVGYRRGFFEGRLNLRFVNSGWTL